jgi:hypothetical protein
MHIKFRSENVKGRVHLGDLGIGGKIILKWIVKKQDVTLPQPRRPHIMHQGVSMLTGFIWLRIGFFGSFLGPW